MPHPLTSLMATYNVNRHDIAERSWPGFRALCEAAGQMFKHNYLLFRQLKQAGAMGLELQSLLDEWKISSGRMDDPDPVRNLAREIQPLDPGRMIDQLEMKLTEYMEGAVDPKDVVAAEICICPPGYVCPICTADGSWKQNFSEDLASVWPEIADIEEGKDAAENRDG